jgi:hypothetical protein
VCHLQTRPLEATLDVEALVRLRAVKNSLVAANVLRDKVQRLDDPQTKLLALLVLCNSNVFDVADEAEVVDAKVVISKSAIRSILSACQSVVPFLHRQSNLQFPLNQQRSCAYDLALAVQDDQHVRADSTASSLLHLIEAGLEVGLRDFAYGRQDTQDIEETSRVVAALERADGVGFGESGGDGGRDEGGGEEGVGGSRGGAFHGCGWIVLCCVVVLCSLNSGADGKVGLGLRSK